VPKIKIVFNKKIFVISLATILVLGVITFIAYLLYTNVQKTALSSNRYQEENTLRINLEKELNDLKNQDQIKINQDLKKNIDEVSKTYSASVKVYESLLDLKSKSKNTATLDGMYAEIVSLLAKMDYKKAQEKITILETKIKEEEGKVAASFTIPQNVPTNNAPPGAGYSRQQVQTDVGSFMVSMIAGDLSSTKIVVDTASEGTCGNDCPTLPLATYVSRSGAYAGVNGSYFCPTEYPQCAGKTNSFDLLVMNKNKVYFNSDNNVYSSNPGVVFGGSYIRFLSAVSGWGRDTGIDGMISNYPLLVSDNNIVFGGDGDPKHGSKGNRSFVANKGNTVYIGVVHSVTVAESARVMKAMGMENALNLDDGGSTALWSGGYKVGPGRNLPNVILFIKK
jgi:hypothetical protein